MVEKLTKDKLLELLARLRATARVSLQRDFTPNASQVPAIFVVAPQAAQVQDDPIQPAGLCLAFRYG